MLDLEMPGAGGLKSIPRIIARGGRRQGDDRLVARRGRRRETVAALALGAADTLPKPGTGRFNGRFSEILLGKLKALGYAAAASGKPASASQAQVAARALRPMPSDPIDILAIGASTGGIHALGALFQALPEADRRADPRHPAPAGAVHDGVRPPARHRPA